MSSGTWQSHHAITTLMYRYAECIDAADFDGIASIFAHGRINLVVNQGLGSDIRGTIISKGQNLVIRCNDRDAKQLRIDLCQIWNVVSILSRAFVLEFFISFSNDCFNSLAARRDWTHSVGLSVSDAGRYTKPRYQRPK